MARGSVVLQRTTTSTTLAAGVLYTIAANGSGTEIRRFDLYDFILGSDATPADVAITWSVQRQTALGSLAASAETIQPLDSADAPVNALAGQTVTVMGTTGVTLNEISLNQRATYRWVAAPGSELVVPATASNGLYFNTPELVGGTPSVWVTAFINEL
jgi:hypothetical protein